jgi:CelD/BcsL family acetyltransferase involved in cellulose biosynthesis
MVVTARPEFALVAPNGPLDDEWDRLCESVGSVPFCRPGWIRAWSTMRKADLRLATIRRNGALAAALPLIRRATRLASPADWHTPVSDGAAADGAALADLAASLAAAAPAVLTLDFVDAESPVAEVIASAFRRAGYRLATRRRMDSPYIDLGLGAAEYFDGLETRKKRELRRRRRRLEEAGRVRFDVGDGGSSRDVLLDEAFAVEAAGWKGDQGTAIVSDAGVEGLYRSVAAWAGGRGMLVIGALRLDGRLIAFDLSLEHRGVHYLLKTGFDPEAARFAPAMQLRALMIERAFDVGLARYEFAGTDDAWKLEWTSTVRRIVRRDAYAPTARGRAVRLGDLTQRRVRRLGKRVGL